MAVKLIITLKGKLKAKYGINFNVLETLFRDLIISDRRRGIDTEIIYLDDLSISQLYGYPSSLVWDEKSCKDVFDQIYWKDKPEYMVIFGAHDIFPFQSLINPLYSPVNDRDKEIPSDLPYASDSPYSADCNSFNNPTRVVGRIADLPDDGEEGKGDIDYVISILEHIMQASPADPAQCADYFAVSAAQWTLSTQLSVRNIFSNSFTMKLSPPSVIGSYTSQEIARLSHYFNLHGALGRKGFYGQSGASYPEAINTADLVGIRQGTFIAAECCYGAQLLSSSQGMSMASTYLKNKATVFMGSSTISYGPEAGQGLADLICQYFHINVLKGASSGRALLDARQKFISISGPTLDAHELKTLAQFYILGDPSLQAVKRIDTEESLITIEERRLNLMSKGLNLGFTTGNTYKTENFEVYPLYELQAKELLKILDFTKADSKMVFEVDYSIAESFNFTSKINRERDMIHKRRDSVRFHVYQKGGVDEDGICNISALVIKERNNIFMGYKNYVSK